jgi:uncharacterized RDD family membrane protein YckC
MPADQSSVRPTYEAVAPVVPEDLPLFLQNAPSETDDEPLVKVPAIPRTPLSVRRATPDPARLRKYDRRVTPERIETNASEPDLLADLPPPWETPVAAPATPAVPAVPARRPAEPAASAGAAATARQDAASLPADWCEPVGTARRLGAAAIDLVLLGGINFAVVVLALRQLGLGLGSTGALPLLPLAAFLLFLDAGYLLMFTAAGGQTIGKMAAGIRVVGTSPGAVINDEITLGGAAMRTALMSVSVLTLGIGFLPGLVGEGRALHDRLAHTRVVRV